METFNYTAISSAGERTKGTLAASSAREARDILRAQQLKLLDINPARSRSKSFRRSGQDVRHKDRTLATRQLAILLETSTPVDEALRVTALNFDKSSMQAILLDVRAKVLEGERLSQAIGHYPKAFPEIYCSMVASAETSGELAPVMERLAQDMEAAMKMRQKITGAIVYPIVLSVVALLVVTILMVAVIPKVVVQFENFGQDLPALTKGVIAVSSWMQTYGVMACFGCLVLGLMAYRALRHDHVKLKWHKFVLGVPLIGNLTRNINAARFSRTMSGLIQSGTPPLSALETAQYTLKNTVMRQAAFKAAQSVREGSAISQAMRQSDIFPPVVIQMVTGGEGSGKLGAMFSKAADYLENEFEAATTVFLNLLEPMIIIFLSLIVLLIIGAIFLPILQLNTLAF